MFSGTYEHAIDEKGRVAIPRPWRDALAAAGHTAQVMATVSLPREEPHLMFYTEARWNEALESVRKVEGAGLNGKPVRRGIVGQQVALAFDKQGRILLPPKFREHAKIVKDVKCVAVEPEKFEMWSPTSYAAQEVEDLKLLNEEFYVKQLKL